ncbi:MAG: hypothetical protein ACYCZK_04415 [Microbacteriaceae bacterium]
MSGAPGSAASSRTQMRPGHRYDRTTDPGTGDPMRPVDDNGGRIHHDPA